MNDNYISGFENEIEFSCSLNNKHFKELGENASRFIKQLYPSIKAETTIHALKIGGLGLKPDVIVTVEDDDTSVSIKKGNNNSVHQEKVTFFLLFCKDYLGIDQETRNCFLRYQFGDGTLDGKGKKEDRVQGAKLKEVYHKEMKVIQDFFYKNRRILIERFLIYGRLGIEKK